MDRKIPRRFWVLQVVLGLPLLFLLLRYQWHRNSIGMMILCSGMFTLGLGLVSRFFQDNYVGYVSVLVTAGIVLIYEDSAMKLGSSDQTVLDTNDGLGEGVGIGVV